jgi:hypothetical protein
MESTIMNQVTENNLIPLDRFFMLHNSLLVHGIIACDDNITSLFEEELNRKLKKYHPANHTEADIKNQGSKFLAHSKNFIDKLNVQKFEENSAEYTKFMKKFFISVLGVSKARIESLFKDKEFQDSTSRLYASMQLEIVFIK